MVVVNTTPGGGSGYVPSSVGFYTPTLVNVANLDGSTAFELGWKRTGNLVTVQFRANVDPTATATLTTLTFDPPIPSDFTQLEDVTGSANANGVAGEAAAFLADTVNNRIMLQWITADATNHAMFGSFVYRIR